MAVPPIRPMLMDVATQLLLRNAAACEGPLLWLADEQIECAAIAALPARGAVFALANRCDVVAAFAARAIPAALSDFDFAIAPPFHCALFRVAKEKALVHHVINRALEQLPLGGTLLLSGDKGDGIKTYIEKAAARAQGDWRIERDCGALLGCITRGAELAAPLDDQGYARPRQIEFTPDFSAWSKPGIFGWKKIDAGSSFLFDHVEQVWHEPPRRVLDLGCGYGYLSVRALRHWPQAQCLAVDNNIAAIHVCALNLREFGVRAATLCDNAGAAIEQRFDAILCNPPFHQGFAHEDELTEKFLRQTYRLLDRGGRALFVVNQFIGIEKMAATIFTRIDVIARNNSFKLVVLER